MYECRCNGRLQTKRSTRLSHTGLFLDHLKKREEKTKSKLWWLFDAETTRTCWSSVQFLYCFLRPQIAVSFSASLRICEGLPIGGSLPWPMSPVAPPSLPPPFHPLSHIFMSCVCVCVCVCMCSSSVQFRNSGDGEMGRELAHAPGHCADVGRMPSSSMRSSVRRASVCMRLRPCIYLTRYCVWLCLAVGFGQLDRARYVSNCRPGIFEPARPD